MVDWVAKRNQEIEARELATARQLRVRDTLYYQYRYRAGSYKARKAMIKPYLLVVRRSGAMLRLYDDGSHQPTKTQEAAMRDKCLGWRAKERDIKQVQMIAYREWRKENKLKGDHFSHWLININGVKGDRDNDRYKCGIKI